MLKIISMKVNGKQRELAVDVRESLADALRNRLALTSVKKGCEVGECGACTVLVDGVSVDSCIYLAVWADGKSILTVEGLQEVLLTDINPRDSWRASKAFRINTAKQIAVRSLRKAVERQEV